MHRRARLTRPLALLALFLGIIALPACRPAEAEHAAAPGALRVVATTSHIADLARHIAGEDAHVTGLLGPGIDPHSYTLTRGDVARLMGADLILYNGLNLEGRMSDAFARAAHAGKRVVPVAEAIGPSRLIAPEGFAGHHDPHVWMDPALWREAVLAATEAFAESDPEHAQAYRERAEAYLDQLGAVESYMERVFASIPANARVLVTAHDAFGYLGRRFGLEVVGIQGISTESEAGVRDIERIVDLLVTRRIPAVFVESTVSDRNVRALIEGARARGHAVRIGGELYSDALGEPGTYEGTYIGMLDHNATVIARALGGEAPEDGMAGRLTEADR